MTETEFCWLVWENKQYRYLELRAVCTSELRANKYARALQRSEYTDGDSDFSVERACLNHLYGEGCFKILPKDAAKGKLGGDIDR